MSSIYNIDFSVAGERLSPPSKRKPLYVAWIKMLFSPLQWFRSMIFESYANSSTAPDFDSSVTYHFGDIVIYEKAVYQYINTVSSSGPFDSINWYMVQQNYIGVRERLRYNSQTIVLEKILNKAFNTSGINIDNTDNDIEYVFFYNEDEGYPAIYYCTKIEDSHPTRDNVVFLYNEVEYSPPLDFIVEVPAALNTSPIVKQLIAAEVEKYKIAGTSFDVQFI